MSKNPVIQCFFHLDHHYSCSPEFRCLGIRTLQATDLARRIPGIRKSFLCYPLHRRDVPENVQSGTSGELLFDNHILHKCQIYNYID